MQQAGFGKILQKPILKIEDLSVSRSGKTIIKDIDLTIEKGEFVGIVGPMEVESLRSFYPYLEY